jgi:PhnB protein
MSTQALYPYMRVSNASDAISFYTRVFGAREDFRLVEPSGRVGHAELNFGGTVLMLCDPFPEMGYLAPDQSPARRVPPCPSTSTWRTRTP